MKIKHLFYFALLVLFIDVLFAQPFSLEADKKLEISFAGIPLVVQEALTLTQVVPAEKTTDLLLHGKSDFTMLPGNLPVYNIYGELEDIKFRREVSILPDSSEVELSFMANVPSYIDNLQGCTVAYEVSIPIDEFVGCSFKSLHGRSSKLIETEGIIKRNSGQIAGASLRQIALERKDGKKLVIDCNAKGLGGSISDYPPNNVVPVWNVYCREDSLVFSRPYKPLFYGGMIAGHLIFYEGTHEDFNKRHASAAYPYFSELKPDRQYVFGAREFGKDFTDAGMNLFTEEKTFGWLKNDEIKVSTYRPRGALYSSVGSDKAASFKMSALRSGLHFITVVSGTGTEKLGPFSVSCNGELIKDNITVAEKSAHTLSFPVWLDEEAILTFSGDWAISTIGDQLLLTSYEDYTFKRGFWLNNSIPEPSLLFSKRSYAKTPQFAVGSSVFPLPEPGQETATPLKSWEEPSSHAVFKEGEDWRGKANIGSMGPSNTGSFLEFLDKNKIARRLKDLKEENFDAILINGMLSRHTFPTHVERSEQNIADIVEQGHKLNMKFIDHQDHTLLWDLESGFRVLVENMPYLQQTITGQLSARGYCPSNPIYKEIFIERIYNHVLKTNIDGIMIDEVSFHGLNFCGCAECRKLFTAETGWYLPADECSEELFNNDSKLWRAWLRWRQKRIGDFWYKLKKRIHSYRPDFVCMGYSTHYGMLSTYASLTQGGALEQSARGWDFLGTEIMTRNIYANYRSIKSLRQAKSQFQYSAGLPIFGLVYTAAFDWDLMYFGWALNNMLGQRTWEMTGRYCPDDKINYRLFTTEKGNIDITSAKQLAKVALFFSNSSRDWRRGSAYTPDILGISQLLNLEQVPHIFINEVGLNYENLKDYNVLFVCNAMSLSEEHADVIREFASAGGTVYLSNRVGAANENGDQREQWIFAEDFKLTRIDRSIRVAKVFGGEGLEEAFEPETVMNAVRCTLAEDSQAKVTWEYENQAAMRFPALYELPYGKGKMIYTPLQFGAPVEAKEVRTLAEFSFEVKPIAEKLGLRVLQDVVKEEDRLWEPINMPEDILTNLHVDNGELTIHFLNATGSKMKKGEIVPVRSPEVAFPAIKEDLRFVVRLANLEKVYAVSADFNGEVELTAKKIAEGKFEITLPADHLHIYTLVRIK